eukprot:scaffold27897_cov15-Tisochrysis_lutea.AAC.2
MWCYGPTAHFKGRHGSKGTAMKRGLAQAIQAGQSASNLLNRTSQLQVYASQHLATPASQQGLSTADRDRAPVKERTFMLLGSAQVEAALSDPERTQLEEQRLISGPTGIHSWHLILFSSSRECWHALYQELACTCSSCLHGVGTEECAAPSKVPAWKQLQLFRVSQLEFQVFQGLRQAGHEVGAGGLGGDSQQDLKGWLKFMKQMYPAFNLNANRNKQLLEKANNFLQSLQAAWGGQQGSVA